MLPFQGLQNSWKPQNAHKILLSLRLNSLWHKTAVILYWCHTGRKQGKNTPAISNSPSRCDNKHGASRPVPVSSAINCMVNAINNGRHQWIYGSVLINMLSSDSNGLLQRLLLTLPSLDGDYSTRMCVCSPQIICDSSYSRHRSMCNISHILPSFFHTPHPTPLMCS